MSKIPFVYSVSISVTLSRPIAALFLDGDSHRYTNMTPVPTPGVGIPMGVGEQGEDEGEGERSNNTTCAIAHHVVASLSLPVSKARGRTRAR